MTSRRFYSDELVLVGEPETALKVEKSVREPRALHNFPLVELSGDPLIESWMQRSLPADYVPAIKVDQIGTAIEIVKRGGFVGFVPSKMVEKDLKQRTLSKLEWPFPEKMESRQGFLVYKDSLEPDILKLLKQWLRLLRQAGFTVE